MFFARCRHATIGETTVIRLRRQYLIRFLPRRCFDATRAASFAERRSCRLILVWRLMLRLMLLDVAGLRLLPRPCATPDVAAHAKMPMLSAAAIHFIARAPSLISARVADATMLLMRQLLIYADAIVDDTLSLC